MVAKILGMLAAGGLIVSLIPACWLAIILLVLTVGFAVFAEPLWQEKTGD